MKLVFSLLMVMFFSGLYSQYSYNLQKQIRYFPQQLQLNHEQIQTAFSNVDNNSKEDPKSNTKVENQANGYEDQIVQEQGELKKKKEEDKQKRKEEKQNKKAEKNERQKKNNLENRIFVGGQVTIS